VPTLSTPTESSTATATDQDYPDSIWRNPNFVRLFVGRLVTNAGESLYSIAVMWLVFEMTGSSYYTGVAGSLLLLPHALQFISGPIVDRFPIRHGLVATQAAQGVVVLVLPVAAVTGHLTVGVILVTVPVLALLNQFVGPAQGAALPRIVADEQLPRSNSAFASVTKGFDMLFEAVGGVIIAAIGAVSLFVVDAATFAVAAASFLGMRIPPAEDGDAADDIDLRGYLADLKTGGQIIWGTVFAELTLATAVSNFSTGVALAVLPAFGAVRSGPALYGGMLAALGGGRLLGSAVASRLTGVKYGHVKIFGYGAGSFLWLGSVLSPWPAVTVGLFLLAWIPAGVSSVMGSTLYQRVIPDHVLGRVSSVSAAAAMFTLPVGAFVGGIVATHLGIVPTMALTASGFGFVSLFHAVRPGLRNLPAMSDIDESEYDLGVKAATGGGEET